MGRLCPEAEAELSPVHDGDKFEPDPVEPGDVAGAPVSWKNTNVRDFIVSIIWSIDWILCCKVHF